MDDIEHYADATVDASGIPIKPRKRRKAKKPTIERIKAQAAFYLGQRAATVNGLRDSLLRRNLRAAQELGIDPQAVEQMVDAAIARFVEIGVLNDKEFSRNKAEVMSSAGFSARKIALKLGQAGVDEDDIEAAIRHREDAAGFTDLKTACVFARRKRLGPYTKEGVDRSEDHERQLMAFARAGYSLNVAKKILSCETLEDLEGLES